ncbi:MAG: hypothetical protein WC783_00880 [Candidatus Paceibacterota bacterium]|jgi:hypothetical protein
MLVTIRTEELKNAINKIFNIPPKGENEHGIHSHFVFDIGDKNFISAYGKNCYAVVPLTIMSMKAPFRFSVNAKKLKDFIDLSEDEAVNISYEPAGSLVCVELDGKAKTNIYLQSLSLDSFPNFHKNFVGAESLYHIWMQDFIDPLKISMLYLDDNLNRYNFAEFKDGYFRSGHGRKFLLAKTKDVFTTPLLVPKDVIANCLNFFKGINAESIEVKKEAGNIFLKVSEYEYFGYPLTVDKSFPEDVVKMLLGLTVGKTFDVSKDHLEKLLNRTKIAAEDIVNKSMLKFYKGGFDMITTSNKGLPLNQKDNGINWEYEPYTCHFNHSDLISAVKSMEGDVIRLTLFFKENGTPEVYKIEGMKDGASCGKSAFLTFYESV